MSQPPIQIKAIHMYEAPSYQKQYYRPFSSHASDMSIVDEIREQTHQGQNMSSAAVSNAASRLIRPQTNVSGEAHIENGWNERRLVFTMEVHCQSQFSNHVTVQYLSGYTSHVGVDHNDNVDPMMRFYFNTVMSFRTVMNTLPGVGTTAQHALQHAAHVITPDSHLLRNAGTQVNGYPSMNSLDNVDHLLRPQDLVNAWQTESLMGHAYHNGIANGDVIDMSTSATGGVSLSRLGNSHSPEYLNRILTAMNSVQSQVDINQISEAENWQVLAGALGEPSVTEFNILTEFVNRMGYGVGGGESSVSWRDLLSSFGEFTDFDRITAIYRTAEVMRAAAPGTAFDPLGTELMGGGGVEVIAANMVVNSVPGILTGCMLSEFSFTATNETVGSPEPYIVMPGGEPRTIARGVDHNKLVNVAIHRIKTELCPMVSNGNTMPFFIQVHSSLVRDTTVTVRIGDGPETPFVVPTWGSAIFTPVAHSTQDNLRMMAHDIDWVHGSVSGRNEAVQPYTAGAEYGEPQTPYAGFSDNMSSVDFSEPSSPDGIIHEPNSFD